MKWSGFRESAPELADRGEQRLGSTGLCLVGTIKADGWPRISPCEVSIDGGELNLGMHWRSRKALDLLRDPRLVVHSTQCDPSGSKGDFKVYGRAFEISEEAIDGTGPPRTHRFAVDIERAAFVSQLSEGTAWRWSAGRGLERIDYPHAQSSHGS